MATKDNNFYSNTTIISNEAQVQHSNLNLNNNWKESNVQSLGGSTESGGTDGANLSSVPIHQSTSNNQSAFNLISPNQLISNSIFENSFDFTTNNSSSNFNPFKNNGEAATYASTLTLHIAIKEEEDRIAAMLAPMHCSDGGDDDSELLPLKTVVTKFVTKKFKNVRDFFNAPSSSSNVHNSFEFPRQQEKNHASTPEVMQFKASQRLLNPDQTPSPGSPLHLSDRSDQPPHPTTEAAATNGEDAPLQQPPPPTTEAAATNGEDAPLQQPPPPTTEAAATNGEDAPLQQPPPPTTEAAATNGEDAPLQQPPPPTTTEAVGAPRAAEENGTPGQEVFLGELSFNDRGKENILFFPADDQGERYHKFYPAYGDDYECASCKGANTAKGARNVNKFIAPKWKVLNENKFQSNPRENHIEGCKPMTAEAKLLEQTVNFLRFAPTVPPTSNGVAEGSAIPVEQQEQQQPSVIAAVEDEAMDEVNSQALFVIPVEQQQQSSTAAAPEDEDDAMEEEDNCEAHHEKDEQMEVNSRGLGGDHDRMSLAVDVFYDAVESLPATITTPPLSDINVGNVVVNSGERDGAIVPEPMYQDPPADENVAPSTTSILQNVYSADSPIPVINTGHDGDEEMIDEKDYNPDDLDDSRPLLLSNAVDTSPQPADVHSNEEAIEGDDMEMDHHPRAAAPLQQQQQQQQQKHINERNARMADIENEIRNPSQTIYVSRTIYDPHTREYLPVNDDDADDVSIPAAFLPALIVAPIVSLENWISDDDETEDDDDAAAAAPPSAPTGAPSHDQWDDL